MKKEYFDNSGYGWDKYRDQILSYDTFVDDDLFMPTRKVDTNLSKKLLIDIMMKKCDITESDLEDISIVKSKLRNSNINEILK